VTNNSLAANQRPHISLIDRRHRWVRRLAYRAAVAQTRMLCMPRSWYALLTYEAISTTQFSGRLLTRRCNWLGVTFVHTNHPATGSPRRPARGSAAGW